MKRPKFHTVVSKEVTIHAHPARHRKELLRFALLDDFGASYGLSIGQI